MPSFNGAQSFYVDPTIVEGSPAVDIAAIGMYFMYRPQALNNRSGIAYPGVTMFMTDVVNGVPNLANTSLYTNLARCEWNAILTSSDASQETVFTFVNPITVKTGKSYAFLWSYDGDEDFLPWFNIKGNDLVGSTTPSPGPSSTYGGSFYSFSSVSSSNSNPTSAQNYAASWNPVLSTDTKFDVRVARYSVNGVPISANIAGLSANTPIYTSNVIISYLANLNAVQITHPSPRTENISFDIASSTKQTYVGAQRVYQKTVDWPGGGVWASLSTNGSNTVTANATLSNGASFSWTNVFNNYQGDKYVCIDYGNWVDVRQVVSILSNTVITVDEKTTATNAAARFMLSPVAVTDSFNTSFLSGKKTSLMFMRDSSANSTVRFVGHAVDNANTNIVAGGSGYSNSDNLYVLGYQYVNGTITDNYPAVANLQTNSTGGVVGLAWSNVGAGFVNSAALQLAVMATGAAVPNTSTANSSVGTGLSMNAVIGTILKTEQTNNIFYNSRPVNIDVHTLLPVVNVSAIANTTLYSQLSMIYYMANNASTANGFATYVSATPQNFTLTAANTIIRLNTLTNIPVIASRSLEFGTHYSNGAINDQVNAVNPYSNTYSLNLITSSNNDYVALGPFDSPLLDWGRYIINNDYTSEQTDSGNSLARHITTVFNMTGPANTNQMAEDVRIYLSAWRPPGTDLQVFTRIQNSTDAEAFIDEDWTRLQLVDGSNNFSSSGYVDLSYGFQLQPNTTSIQAGSVTTTNASGNIVGSNTNWTFPNNTLVKIYDPLFANQNFAICLATNVVNTTFIQLDQVFSTNNITGIGGFELTGRGGLSLDVLAANTTAQLFAPLGGTGPAGVGHQAFNNIQNENVVRYYNASEHVYDGFNILQVKAIMLSGDPHNIPRIHNIRGIGLSA